VGIGITLLPVLYRFGGFGGKPPVDGQRRFLNDPEPYLRIVEALGADCAADPNAVIGLAPHSLRAVNQPLLAEVLAQAKKEMPIHIHIAEQVREVEACLQWCGQRPLQWLFERIDVDQRWCLVHATHMNADEIGRLASSGAVAGLCPSTEANLGDGLFQALPYLAEQGRFGIGSDSNVSVSPVEELRWLEYGQRLARKQRCVFADGPQRSTARQLLDHILAGGARACGRQIGRLEPGYRADFLVLDTDHPLLYGRRGDDLLDSWVFAGNANAVRDVYVGGVQVVADGVHAEEERIGARFRQVMSELLG
jgi:formimidoylglutamate deiminase